MSAVEWQPYGYNRYGASINGVWWELELDGRSWLVSYEHHHKTLVTVVTTLAEAKRYAVEEAERLRAGVRG